MRSFLLSAIAVTVLASSAIALSADADAATTRRPQHRAATPPIVRQVDPYSAYNTFGAPGFDAFHTQRNVNPISGTPRWNAAGGAP